MKSGKINMLILILIIVVTLILGIGIGIYVGTNLNKNRLDETKTDKTEQLGETIIDTPENTTIKNEQIVEDDEIKYDGEKKIFVNGEICRISYNNKLIRKDENEEYSEYMSTIFVNDKEIKQITTYGDYLSEMMEVTTMIDAANYKKEYVLITLNNTFISVPHKDFILVSTEGTIIKELERSGADAMYLLNNNIDTGDSKKRIQLKTSVIERDKITLYYSKDPSEDCNTTTIIEKTYRIINGQVEEKLSEEVRLKGLGYAGK